MALEKRCSRCKLTKPINLFNSNSAQRDGLCNQCMVCVGLSRKEYNSRKKALVIVNKISIFFGEVFKDVIYDGIIFEYKVSNFGRIISNKWGNEILMTPYKETLKNGEFAYLTTSLRYPNKNKNYSVRIHRLVAIAHIPNPNNFPEVNHIFGDKWNNNDWNLEWASISRNRKHAFDLGLNIPKKGKESIHFDKGRKVIVNGKIYNSVASAGRDLNIPRPSLSSQLRGDNPNKIGIAYVD